jgi:hypothetical protein
MVELPGQLKHGLQRQQRVLMQKADMRQVMVGDAAASAVGAELPWHVGCWQDLTVCAKHNS